MSERMTDIWQDPAEAIGDLLIEKSIGTVSPALAQMPLLSIAIAAYRSKGAIADYLLARKVQQFYTAWDRLDKRERRSIYQKFQKKPRAFTEKLLYILAQQEDLAKCRLLGVLTTSYLQGTLKRAAYLDLIETVVHLSLRDLTRLGQVFCEGLIFAQDDVGERYATLFVTRGMIVTELPLPEEQRIKEPRTFYRLTPLGTTFVRQLHLSGIGEAA